MLRHIFRRFRQMPVPALGVLLFAAILSLVLGALEKSSIEEQRKYEETFDTIPVTFTVTNLSGTRYLDMDIMGIFVYPFQQGGCLEPFVSDLQLVVDRYAADGTRLSGITSTALSPELSPDKQTVITWKESYDESIFLLDENLALIPEDMDTYIDKKTGREMVSLFFQEVRNSDDVLEYTCRLTVAGTYSGGDESTVYCPHDVCIRVCYHLVRGITYQGIRATLANNRDLEALRESALEWFAEPNPLGEETVWENGQYGYDYYPYALDINDSLLKEVTNILQASITTNRICALLVLCLSAAAGLLIGFLMVRSRRREIALMRTMGTSNGTIFCSFLLEQMLCFGLGILFGGAYNHWQPAGQLMVLPAIFFAGLTTALLICLRNNLLTTIKEDE